MDVVRQEAQRRSNHIFVFKSLDRLQQRIVTQWHEKLAVKKHVELKKLCKSLNK